MGMVGCRDQSGSWGVSQTLVIPGVLTCDTVGEVGTSPPESSLLGECCPFVSHVDYQGETRFSWTAHV